MKVLFLSNLFPPHDLGGYEQWCDEIAAELRNRGHCVHVLTSSYRADGVKGQAAEPDVTRSLYLQTDFHHYSPAGFFLRRARQDRENRLALQTVIDHFGPDVLVVWGMNNLSTYLPYWAELKMPGRVAYYIASYWPSDEDVHHRYWRTASRTTTKIFKATVGRVALRQLRREDYPPHLRFQHVMCCSNSVLDRFVETSPDNGNTGVILGGINPLPFLERGYTRRHIDDGPLRLLYFGSLLPQKGVHTAIEALGILVRQGAGERVELTLMGDGHPDYESYLRTLVSDLALADRVRFVARTARSDVPSRLGSFDSFLFTSIWPEPFGRVIVEAMAAGLVVIGSDVGGSREIFEHLPGALLFPPGDSLALSHQIRRLLEEPQLLVALAQAGPKIVLEHFSLERMAAEIEAWLGDLITGESSPLSLPGVTTSARF